MIVPLGRAPTILVYVNGRPCELPAKDGAAVVTYRDVTELAGYGPDRSPSVKGVTPVQCNPAWLKASQDVLLSPGKGAQVRDGARFTVIETGNA